jgi:hypothetical protein
VVLARQILSSPRHEILALAKKWRKTNILLQAPNRRGSPRRACFPCAGEGEPLFCCHGGIWPAAWESREINGLREDRGCDRTPAARK